MIITIIICYLVLVLAIGLVSGRFFRGTGEDYFVASRTIGPFVLLMTLFGTHMTSFSLLGASGEAYRQGIGVFGLMASSSALVVPTVFYFVGIRVWALGKRHGYLSPIQYFRDRWGSPALGLVLFFLLTALLIPYILIGVMGGGITMAQMSEGAVPSWVGGVMVCGVIFVYVIFGGMRGTAWVNTFQTSVFMVLGAVTFFVVVSKMGGLSAALDAVATTHPELLVRGDKIQPLKLFTYAFIPLSVGMFPHIFIHWLTAKKAATFKFPIIFYPLCVAVVWIPSVLLGVTATGSTLIPELQGPEANSVLVRLVAAYAPGVLGGLLAAGVFAAIMSSLDSQVLSLGNMFTQDIVRYYGFHNDMSEKRQVLSGRLFVFGILVITFLLSQVTTPNIFKLGVWSFTGFAALFPILVAALYWKRSTTAGAWASVIGVALLWLYFFLTGADDLIARGIMPAAIMVVASTVLMIVVSLLTKQPDADRLRKFFPTSQTVGGE